MTVRQPPTTGTLDLKIKASAVLDAAGQDQGIVTAYVSVFGNKDSYGDVVVPGAFAGDVAAFEAGEKLIPVIWSHQRQDPMAFVGDVTALKEDETGLLVMDEPLAKKSYGLVKSGRVNQWSFGYRVNEGAWVETADESYYELRSLSLHEVGPTLVGANSETRTVEAKSADSPQKAGRTISSATRKALESAKAALSAANEEIDALIALTDDGKSAPESALSAVDGDPATEHGNDAVKAPEVVALTADEASRVAKALG